LKRSDLIQNKIYSIELLQQKCSQWRMMRKTIAFTNGVFDIIHSGHLASLSAAAAEADFLVIGLNSDTSVKKLKGEGRPLNDQHSRAMVLASLLMTDVITIFEEDTPLELIKLILPDVLIKGGDYTIEQIAGAKEVIAAGGRVVINPILEGFSTTTMIERMKNTK
jgi:rfaE bifunctional protein nucleotidyltransferase chain/domain